MAVGFGVGSGRCGTNQALSFREGSETSTNFRSAAAGGASGLAQGR